MRKLLKDNEFGFPEDTIVRGVESSRIEQLSDGVFALAITMLLISLETPKNYDELVRFTQDLIVFVVCMVVIVRVWYGHYFFFLKYNLRDKQTIFINTFLLLVVLFFVYPLKFLASVLLRFYFYLLLAVIIDQAYWKNIQDMTSGTFSWQDMPSIMIIYGCGYLGLIIAFLLLYRHALERKKFLNMSAQEILEGKKQIHIYYAQIAVTLVSIAIAFLAKFTPYEWLTIVSGCAYLLIWPAISRAKKSAAKHYLTKEPESVT